MAAVTEQAVIDALRMVMEPELHKDLITLNMVKDLKIEEGTVKFTVVLTTPACPLKTEIKASCDKAVGAVAGVTKVDVDFTANVQQGRSQIKDNLIPTVKNTIAVSSHDGLACSATDPMCSVSEVRVSSGSRGSLVSTWSAPNDCARCFGLT